MKDAVIVLGMHRSGTSAVSGALTILGAASPKNLMQPDQFNERGYFESIPIMELNDAILASRGSSWTDWRPLNQSWLNTGEAQQFRARASALVLEEFQNKPLIVLKDPRIAKLSEFWFGALEDAGYRSHSLAVVRNPLEVAASLRRRNEIPIARSLLIWLRYVLDSEAGSRGSSRSILVWNHLHDDWRGAMEKASLELGLAWPRQSDFVSEEIDSFFSDELRHHQTDTGLLFKRNDIHEWVKAAYKAFETLSVEQNSNSALNILDGIRVEFDKTAKLYGPAFVRLETEADKYEHTASQLRSITLQRDAALERVRELETLEEALRKQVDDAHGAHLTLHETFEQAIANFELDAARIEEALSQSGSGFSAQVAALSAELAAARDEAAAARDRAAQANAALEQLRAEFAEQNAALAAELALAREQTSAERDRAARVEQARAELQLEFALNSEAASARLGSADPAEETARLHEREQATARFLDRLESEVGVLEADLQRYRNAAAAASARADAMRIRADESEARFREIQGSEAWRLTAPLRALGNRSPAIAVAMRRLAKAVWWTLTLQIVARYKARRRALTVARAPDRGDAPLPTERPSSPASERNERGVEPIAVTPVLPPEPDPRTEAVDVIVCVHNALEDVQLCLGSLIRSTLPPYRIILVDDGSQPPTRDFLAQFSSEHGAALIRHEVALGYTFAANAGLRSSSAPFCVLLNSDTEVTDGWLDRLMDVMRREVSAGIVGPLSNTASWQSIPELMKDGDWADNPLPSHLDADGMAKLVARGAHRRGVPLGFINGFAMLLRRQMLDQVGLFDEVTFGAGYGEENDLCIRARKAGWRLFVAEDTYIFHHQSRSYGHERRKALAAAATKALEAKHDSASYILPFVYACRDSLLMHAARVRIAANMHRDALVAGARRRFEMKRVLFILPVADAGGGANVVIQELRAMRRFGVDAWLLNRIEHAESFERAYPNLDIPVLYAGGDLAGKAKAVAKAQGLGVDAIVATAFQSFAWLPHQNDAVLSPESPKLGYYIQDQEALFFPEDEVEREMAHASYRDRPDVVRLTKSRWNRDSILGVGGLPPVVVGASVDLDVFYPRSDDGLDLAKPVRIVAMVRAETPRRAPQLTFRLLRRLKDHFGARVDVACFGSGFEAVRAFGIPMQGVSVHGGLIPPQVAELLGRSDVFLDLSVWQAMGLTALEAMASGCAVVVPERGGAKELVIDGISALVVDTSDEEACFAAASKLVTDSELRLRMRRAGMEVAAEAFPEQAALRLLDALMADQ